MTDSVESLKQRVVGAVVILSLAIIFLPMLFDKPHETESTQIVAIPPKPDFKTVTITKPEKPQLNQLESDASSQKVIQKKPVAVATPASKKEIVPPTRSEPAFPKPVAKAASVKEDVQKTPKAPVTTKQPTPGSVSHLPVFKDVWMVQLGTFSNKSNAYKLRDRLRKDGFDSHTKPIKINGKPSIRVFSGPYVSKREAQKRKKKLDAKYGVKSLVLFFEA